MYKCEITGKVSKLGEPLHKMVIATRPQTYRGWVKNEETNQYEEKVIGEGWEIVKEIGCSAEGEQMWNNWCEGDRQAFISRHYPHLAT